MYTITRATAAHLVAKATRDGFSRAVDWWLYDQCKEVPQFLHFPRVARLSGMRSTIR